MSKEIEQLRKEFNERIDALLKQPAKFEVGKWYHAGRGDIINYQGVAEKKLSQTHVIYFGFCNQEWKDKEIMSINYMGKECTPSEIGAALIAEAKRRGFKEGVKYSGIGPHDTPSTIKGTEFRYSSHGEDSLCQWGAGFVYFKGQWAEIINDEKIEIGGYEVKFEEVTTTEQKREHGTKIDGHYFSKLFWESAKVVSLNNKAKIMVGCSKQFDVSLDVINKILAKL